MLPRKNINQQILHTIPPTKFSQKLELLWTYDCTRVYPDHGQQQIPMKFNKIGLDSTTGWLSTSVVDGSIDISSA
jgi:hypothetical protein